MILSADIKREKLHTGWVALQLRANPYLKNIVLRNKILSHRARSKSVYYHVTMWLETRVQIWSYFSPERGELERDQNVKVLASRLVCKKLTNKIHSRGVNSLPLNNSLDLLGAVSGPAILRADCRGVSSS